MGASDDPEAPWIPPLLITKPATFMRDTIWTIQKVVVHRLDGEPAGFFLRLKSSLRPSIVDVECAIVLSSVYEV